MSFENNKPIEKLPSVNVSLLKRRKSTNRDVLKAQRKRSIDIRKKTVKFQSRIKRPAHFINQARKIEREKLRLARYAKKKRPVLVFDKPKLGLVVRLKDDKALPKTCIQVFKLLRLDWCNQAVFVKVTQPMLELLTLVKPFIVWGYPTLQTIRALIEKRGRTSRGSKVHSITNKLIEEKMSSKNILCLEDIIHELVTMGPNLRDVLGFLHPFKLFPPSVGWFSGEKRCNAAPDSLTAYREENVNEMIHRMI